MVARIIALAVLSTFLLFTSWLLPPFLNYGLVLCLGIILFFINYYPDKFLLHFLQSREITESDHPLAYRIARSEAHWMQIPIPALYGYSGFFHRAFCLAGGNRVAFVVERTALDLATPDELRALFFGLCLEQKQKIAKRRTLALLVVALLWAPALQLSSPWSHRSSTARWVIQYLIGALAGLGYRLSLPPYRVRRYVAKLERYSWQHKRLCELMEKLVQPRLGLSVSRQLHYQLCATHHAAPQQLILALEGMAHAFDGLVAGSPGSARV